MAQQPPVLSPGQFPPAARAHSLPHVAVRRRANASVRFILATITAIAALTLAADDARAQVATGSYTGNATADRTIGGIGFQPDMVIVKSSGGQEAICRTSSMPSGNAKPLGTASGLVTNTIKTFVSSGFTVGTASTVNANSSTYHYLALKSLAGRMAVGSYAGNNAASQSITGLGFRPEVVMLFSSGTNVAALRLAAMSASHFFQGGTSTTIITSLDSNGFTVGTHGSANANGNTYYYVALKSGTDFLVSGSYTGNGTDNRSINSGFRPDYLFIGNGNNYPSIHRTDEVSGDATLQFTAAADAANMIQAFESSGFQVGNDNSTNRNAVSYFYLAFTKFGIFESRASDVWDTATTWTLVAGEDGDTIPDGNDSLLILGPHTVTLTQEERQFGMGISGALDAASYTVSGSGGVVMNSGSTLKTRLATGVNGALTMTGAKVLSTSSNFEFNGSSAQVTGTTMPTTVNNLTVNNSAGASLSQSTTVNGTLGLTAGALTIGANTLTINGDIVTAAGSLNGSGSSSVIIIGGTVVGTTLPPVTCSALTMRRAPGIAIGGAVNVYDSLTMNFGNITTGSNVLTLGAGTSTLGTLNYFAGTVVGYFRRWFDAATATNRVFPVGTAGFHRPATIAYTTAPASGGTLTARFVEAIPDSNGLPLADGATTINRLCVEGYWTITSGDGLGGGTYSLDLLGTAFSGVAVPSSVRIVKRPNSASPWTLDGTHLSGGGSVSAPLARRTGMSGFSDFAIGGGSDNPLPIELASFSLASRGRSVTLSWETASELDNAGFEVQRVAPGESEWRAIASYNTRPSLAGLGTSAVGRVYEYVDGIDEPLAPGVYSYRLVDIALDGTRTEHLPRSIEIAGAMPALGVRATLAPNPTMTTTDLRLWLESPSRVDIQITNALGERVEWIREIELPAGNSELPLPTASYPAGRYLVRIAIDGRALYRILERIR
jgi:hypothetical protein